MGDYAQAITNGFTIAWEREPEYRIVCWAHCLRKFDEYISPVTNKKTKDEVYDDLYMLQSSQSYEIFQEGKRLFLKKWSTNKQVTNCLKSFFKVWGKPDTENWYEGYHPLGCVPSTDNALESTNNIVKTNGTLRKRLPVGQFVGSVENKVLKDFSTDRSPTIIKNGKEEDNMNYSKHKYNDEPNLDLATMTHAWQWYSKKTHKIIIYKDYYWYKKEGNRELVQLQHPACLTLLFLKRARVSTVFLHRGDTSI